MSFEDPTSTYEYKSPKPKFRVVTNSVKFRVERLTSDMRGEGYYEYVKNDTTGGVWETEDKFKAFRKMDELEALDRQTRWTVVERTHR